MKGPLDLKLDIRRQPEAQTGVGKPGDVAAEPREKEPLILKKLKTSFDADDTGLDDIDIFGDKRPLLRRRESKKAYDRDQYRKEPAKDASHYHSPSPR